MRYLWKGILLGGTGGAVYAGYRSYQRDEPMDMVVERAAKGAGEVAVAGAAVGFVIDRRKRRKLARQRAKLGTALAAGSLVEAARAVRPVLETAAERTREAANRAAEAAGPALETAADRVSSAAEAARPRVEHAIEVAKPKVEHAIEVAKPKVEHAIEVAKPKAAEAAERTRKGAIKAAKSARTKAHEFSEATRPAIDGALNGARERVTVLV